MHDARIVVDRGTSCIIQHETRCVKKVSLTLLANFEKSAIFPADELNKNLIKTRYCRNRHSSTPWQGEISKTARLLGAH